MVAREAAPWDGGWDAAPAVKRSSSPAVDVRPRLERARAAFRAELDEAGD